jgi:anti-anti-sigma factor
VGDDFSVTRTAPGAWAVEGELDLATAPTFEQALTSDEAPGDLRLDCSKLVFMDSQGVRSLLVAAGGRPPGGRLVLEHLSPEVRRIADLVQLGAAPGILLDD